MTLLLNLKRRMKLSLALMLAARFIAVCTCMAQHTVDFTQGANLQQIYEGGLRPWRSKPQEFSSLHMTDENIRIVPPRGRPFELNVEIGTLGILAGNQLSKADFTSQPMTFNQAVTKAREICQAMGIDIAKGVGKESFEEKAAQLATLGKQAAAPQYWNGRGKAEGVSFGVTLSPLFGWDEIRGKVSVYFDFYEPGKPMKFLTEPVKPPPGYEHMSMEPPETHPEKPFPDPVYSRENLRMKLEEAKASSTPASVRSSTPTPSSLVPTAAEKPTQKIERKSSAWPWIVGGILVLVVIVALVFKRRS